MDEFRNGMQMLGGTIWNARDRKRKGFAARICFENDGARRKKILVLFSACRMWEVNVGDSPLSKWQWLMAKNGSKKIKGRGWCWQFSSIIRHGDGNNYRPAFAQGLYTKDFACHRCPLFYFIFFMSPRHFFGGGGDVTNSRLSQSSCVAVTRNNVRLCFFVWAVVGLAVIFFLNLIINLKNFFLNSRI